MSLRLDDPMTDDHIEVKTWGLGSRRNMVSLGQYEVSMADFLAAALYVLTNTDLMPSDPRLQFIEDVKGLKVVPGYQSLAAGEDKGDRRLD